MTTRQRQDRQTTISCALIGIAEEVVASTKTDVEKTVFAAMAIDAIRGEIAHYCALGDRMIDLARAAVLEGEQVPNAEKIYSIFELGGWSGGPFLSVESPRSREAESVCWRDRELR
jgi:IS5 family transposase